MKTNDIYQLVEELRAKFDASFQEAPRTSDDDNLEVLVVRVGDRRCAVPLNELAGIHRCPQPTPLPSRTDDLVGLVGVRGKLVGVVALTALLDAHVAPGEPRWLLLVAGFEDVGLSCSAVEGYRCLQRADISRNADISGEDSHRLGLYRDAQTTFEIYSVSSWKQSWSPAGAAPPSRSYT